MTRLVAAGNGRGIAAGGGVADDIATTGKHLAWSHPAAVMARAGKELADHEATLAGSGAQVDVDPAPPFPGSGLHPADQLPRADPAEQEPVGP